MTRPSKNLTADPPLLRVGLIAPADAAPPYVAALAANPEMCLAAQGGLPQTAAQNDVPWFDDLRVLIAQGPIDAVILAVSPRSASELAAVAAEQGRDIWRPPPLARNFSEAVEALRRIRSTPVIHRVGSWWEHVRETVSGVLLRTGAGLPFSTDRGERSFTPTLSDADISAVGPELSSWWASMAESGGGVLLSDAYDALEGLLAVRGLPERVFGTIGKCRSKAIATPRETPDFVEALLRYADDGAARISARWDLPPAAVRSHHHGPETAIILEPDRVEIRGSDGGIVAQEPLPTDVLAAELTRFARDVRSRATRDELDAIMGRHLAVSALVEAIFLSARTGQPESPRRLYEAQKWEEPIR